MRRTGLFALMITLLLLTGCSAGEGWEARFEDWRTGLADAPLVSFTADITANTGEETLRYSASLTRKEGISEVEILSPDILAGVKLRSGDGGVTLEYDGASLELGSCTKEGLSPAGAMPAVMDALCAGRVTECGREREGDRRFLRVTLASSDEGELTVWIEEGTGLPVGAELASGGRVAIRCEIRDWHREDKLA
jgi:outer membrane lipoprotein-sorting protein